MKCVSTVVEWSIVPSKTVIAAKLDMAKKYCKSSTMKSSSALSVFNDDAKPLTFPLNKGIKYQISQDFNIFTKLL